MRLMPEVIEQPNVFLAGFRDLEPELARHEPGWLLALRREAIQRFADLGVPTVQQEDWRHTNVEWIAKTRFELVPPKASRCSARLEDMRSAFFGELPEGNRLVFVNGIHCAALSSLEKLPAGVEVANLAAGVRNGSGWLEEHLARQADLRTHPFVALNTALWHDGALVRVPKGVVVEAPIHFVFLTAGSSPHPIAGHPRALVVLEREAQATVVESYLPLNGGGALSNAVTELVVGEGAVLDHCRLQAGSSQSSHLGVIQVAQQRSSSFRSCALSFGSTLVRQELTSVLQGDGAECALNGLYLVQDRQHADNRTTVEHVQPHGTSRQLYNGILDGRGSGVFNGRIRVHPEAQKTDAIQKNRNLLLSEEAVINTKPQLEIFANDVRCTHGATIGQLDANALFYLRSRGIDEREARRLLVRAFAGEVLDTVRSRQFRALAEKAFQARLSSNGKEAL
jgi:Fe-S cluster assembly protein SufD